MSRIKDVKNYQFINSLYFKKEKMADGTVVDDQLYIIYKDLNTKKKSIMKIPKPKMDIYVIKEEAEKDFYQSFVKKEDCEKLRVPFSDLTYQMCMILDQMGIDVPNPVNENEYIKATKWFYACLQNKMGRRLGQIHQHGNVFYSSDLDIEDFYKGKFLDKYGSNLNKLTKGFYDIEVDISRYDGGFPREEEAPCEVNALTFVYPETMECYTYLLRDSSNPLIQEFEDNLDEFKSRISKEFADYGDYDYKIKLFNKEIDLIKNFFDDVNRLQPDFMCAYNAKFDIVTLVNRIIKLGFDPLDIVCHPDFDDLVCKYHFDYKHSAPEERNDWFECSSYSIWVDQYLFYTQLRKGLGKKDSYRLNDIAKDEIGDEKLDYSESGSIGEMILQDWDLFVRYNIKDVLLCAKLEEKNEDVTLFYTLADITRTRLFKAMKKTISIKNLANKFYYDQGYIMGNNMNVKYVDYEAPSEKYDGALVASPLNNTNVGLNFLNRLSKFIFDLVIDYDLSSLYPSIMRCFNIDSSTQYGRIVIDKTKYTIEMVDRILEKYIDQVQDKEDMEKRDLGGELLEDYNSRDFNFIAIKWLGMPTQEQNIRDFQKFMKEKGLK